MAECHFIRGIRAQDIASQLREQGIKSVEDVIDHLRRAADQMTEDARSAVNPIDFRRFSVPPDYKIRRDTVQRIPTVPVLIDRTLYDPADIRRFDGHELHFVVAPNGQSMVAISDRAVISKWWEMIYISSVVSKSPYDALNAFGADEQVIGFERRAGEQGQQGSVGLHSSLTPTKQPIAAAAFSRVASTVIYFEDDNFGGWSISHDPNRGYADLTRVHMGVFGLGSDWNDKISSVFAQNVQICVLHEHIRWTGQTLSLSTYVTSSPEGPVGHPIRDERTLHPYGWNDRASSVEGW